MTNKIPNFDHKESIKNYLMYMHEIVIRTDIIAEACKGKLSLSPPYAREYIYLQFRYICELIALGSLQLHGYLSFGSKANKEWNATKIMNLIHKKHPNCFPQCVTTESKDGVHNIKANSKPDALTINEFKILYNECGNVLHKGKIRTVETSFLNNNHNYNQIIIWQKKVVDLMNEHLIGRSDSKSFYLISLKSESGYPSCKLCHIGNNGVIEIENFDISIA